VGKGAIDPNELVHNLQASDHGNRSKLEDAALRRIYRGYLDATPNLWVMNIDVILME
jgi:hypothetical protein